MATEVKRITLRRGTTAEWTNANPLLEFGEIGVEVASDGTVKFKMGDSSNSWANLPYFESGSLSDFIATAEKGAANGVASLNSDSLIPLIQLGNATSYTDGEVSGHNASTTNVHGISNTANLATQEYVDNVASGITAKPSVKAASTTSVAGTYDNGTNGVNSTITSATNGAWPGLDDITTGWELLDGILLKDQTNAAENGRWVVQDLGSATTPWVLRRCSLCDEPDEIPGMYIFVVSGTQNAGAGYVALVDDPDTFTVGVDDINMTQFAGGASLTGGSGIQINGTEISIDPAVVAQLNSPTFTGTVTATSFSGNLTGNVTGTADNSLKIDGRSVYVQSSQPSSGIVSGDIWIKTI